MVEAHQNLGNVYFDQGHFEQAVAEFRRALAIDPKFAAAQKRLLQAEEAAKLHKIEISPFGRLVDAPPEDDVRQYRELSDEERDRDRAALETILLGVHEATRALIAQLRTKLDPGVREFDRAVVDHAKSRTMLTEARQEFRHTVNAFRTLHRELNRHVKHLHDHEQSMQLPPDENRAS
jgi:tetratricopeptide (TPR) repeat protein